MAGLQQFWVDHTTDLIEKHAVKQSASRIEELVRIFIHATRVSLSFFNSGGRMQLADQTRWKWVFGTWDLEK